MVRGAGRCRVTECEHRLFTQSSTKYNPIATISPLPNPRPLLPTTTSPDQATAFTMAGLPVTRVTASNRPAITTQMPKDWMRQYEDRSKEAQESPGKGQVDIEIIQKFRIVWWENVCNFYSILTFIDTLHCLGSRYMCCSGMPLLAKVEGHRLSKHA